ncbi:VPLPA-CTERM sorting domain-containing protein [Pseudooceanicola onchidii]|uniref:VPLPA-CTERM sorting domain-containing protein n=1 Tax=Pseudooceanicola onchidii TaxID=2562279 RepID=UPI0010A9BFF5|nr:VPLPA-CTERM sorting domain-containing protein [Pseudooceanicola onchidii]
MIRMTMTAAAVSIFALTAAEAATVASGATLASNDGGIESNDGPSYAVSHGSYSSEVTTPASEWVWNGTAVNVDTTYTFTFDLTGYDVSSASLSGKWGVDNVGTVALNGTILDSLNAVVTGNFNSLHDYSANTGFLAGVNSLVFTLRDVGAPGAFRATAVVDATAVPLPASAPLLLAAIGGVAALRRKRRG